MSDLVGLSLTNHCLDHSEIFFMSVFTMLHKLFILYDFSPMDLSSANNLHKPIGSSAMSLINTKKRRVKDGPLAYGKIMLIILFMRYEYS